MILALLIIPIYFLFYLTNQDAQTPSTATHAGGGNQSTPESQPRFDRIDSACIGILLISTLAFSATVSLFTSARRQEIVGASAAYVVHSVTSYGLELTIKRIGTVRSLSSLLATSVMALELRRNPFLQPYGLELFENAWSWIM